MRRLWVWLTASFVLITLIGITLASLLAAWRIDRAFRRFVLQTEAGIGSTLSARLANYYARVGSWEGVERVLRPPMGMGMGPMMHRPGILLADAEGYILFDSSRHRQGKRMNLFERWSATPILVGGRVVGYVDVVLPQPPMRLPATARAFLGGLRRALWQAGLIAGLLGVFLGLLLSRTLAAPLARLTAAARAVAAGDLSQRVPETGPEEVAELGRAFNQMTAALGRAEELRRNMVIDIAHELRTPLTVIQGGLQAILDGVYPLRIEEIAAIYDETRLLSRLIDDLRELAQAEAGQLTLERRPVPIADLVQAAIAGFAPVAEERGIRLEAQIPSELPPVDVDPDRIHQVLRNLVVNALRHTPPGGRIQISAEAAPSGFITLRVRDTGSGIAPEDLPYVFERFWRADRSRARESGGAGLGLAIARHLVEAHGGRIGVESRPGQGATFWFTLPVAVEKAKPSERADANE